MPLLRSARLVLAGDHCQLPPTVLSREAVGRGFGVSLLERLVALYGNVVTRRLDVQYRMNEAIMGFSSREFYDDELVADSTVAGHRLCDLPGVRAEPLTEQPVQFLDTAGAGYDEEVEPDGESRLNPQEASLVARKVHALVGAGVSPADIAVIAPYAAQVRRLRELLPLPGLEIDSVDGFQGREKEAVVLSLVRSNVEGEIGFLADVRRLNVALTRARRKLLVIGDSATLSVLPFYRRLFEYFEEIGRVSNGVDGTDAVRLRRSGFSAYLSRLRFLDEPREDFCCWYPHHRPVLPGRHRQPRLGVPANRFLERSTQGRLNQRGIREKCRNRRSILFAHYALPCICRHVSFHQSGFIPLTHRLERPAAEQR